MIEHDATFASAARYWRDVDADQPGPEVTRRAAVSR
jgi:hypothetical protein